MDDKFIMEDLLQVQKSLCDLYLHGSIESSTANVHSAFDCGLQDTLKTQNEIYNKMSAKGWYQTQQADTQQIESLKQKFCSS